MLILHLKDRFKCCPTWCMHELSAQSCVVRARDFAEEFEFVLYIKSYPVSLILREVW